MLLFVEHFVDSLSLLRRLNVYESRPGLRLPFHSSRNAHRLVPSSAPVCLGARIAAVERNVTAAAHLQRVHASLLSRLAAVVADCARGMLRARAGEQRQQRSFRGVLLAGEHQRRGAFLSPGSEACTSVDQNSADSLVAVVRRQVKRGTALNIQ